MTLTTNPVRVATGAEEEGCLVFSDRPVAVLARLSDRHEVAPGRWFWEAGFGPLGGPIHPTFASIEEAKGPIRGRLERPRRNARRCG
jgi:hypothetical protein